MDKVAEYQSKKLNKELAKTVAAMPSSMRAMFGDQKFLNTEENIKQFNGLTNKLTSQLTGILSSKLNIDSLVKQADALAISGALWADSSAQSAVEVLDLSGDNANQEEKPLITTPKVPVCYAEDVVAQAIALNKDTISGILKPSNVHRCNQLSKRHTASGQIFDLNNYMCHKTNFRQVEY